MRGEETRRGERRGGDGGREGQRERGIYAESASGTCHRSQKCESLYLSIVIFVVYWASMLWREGHHLPCEAVAVVRLRQLVRFSLALHLFVYYVFPHPHHEFHAEPAGRPRGLAGQSVGRSVGRPDSPAVRLWATGRAAVRSDGHAVGRSDSRTVGRTGGQSGGRAGGRPRGRTFMRPGGRSDVRRMGGQYGRRAGGRSVGRSDRRAEHGSAQGAVGQAGGSWVGAGHGASALHGGRRSPWDG